MRQEEDDNGEPMQSHIHTSLGLGEKWGGAGPGGRKEEEMEEEDSWSMGQTCKKLSQSIVDAPVKMF